MALVKPKSLCPHASDGCWPDCDGEDDEFIARRSVTPAPAGLIAESQDGRCRKCGAGGLIVERLCSTHYGEIFISPLQRARTRLLSKLSKIDAQIEITKRRFTPPEESVKRFYACICHARFDSFLALAAHRDACAAAAGKPRTGRNVRKVRKVGSKVIAKTQRRSALSNESD